MAISNSDYQLALVVSSDTTTSYEGLLEAQKELISKQICELQKIVSTQCKLTGVNPLSQEMAAGALSIKIGKRPRDLLNPKAIKYMQSIFSVKDEISKKETRAISALFGLTATQVRDFFNGQRSRVRRFIRLSREKAIQSAEGVQGQDGSLSSNVDVPNQPLPLNSVDPSRIEAAPCSMQSAEGVQGQDGSLSSNVDVPNQPLPLNSVDPSRIEAAPCSMQDEVLPDTDDSEKYFIANIFNLLRKEETFTGQVKLMEWILQIQNASVLYWFLTNGGVMILASWLSQAAIEEQTTVLHVILRVLCHLPLHKALPAHMSAILQSVNKLRFYRGSDISNRAKSLLSRWSKMFARSQAMRRHSGNVSSVDAQNEMLLKQSIGEIMENESLELRIDNPEAICSLQENSENSRSQSIKLLTGASDDSNIKLLRGVSSSHTRERRKVQLVEQPGQKPASRGPLVTRLVSTTRGRPLSADDIQKAKMRAHFMRSKYGESYGSPQVKTEVPRAKAHVHPKLVEHAASSSSPSSIISLAAKPHFQPKIEEATSSSMISLEAKPHVQPKIEEATSSSMVSLEAKPYVQPKIEETTSSSMISLEAKPLVQPKVEEHKMAVKPVSSIELQEVAIHGKEIVGSEEPVWKKCKRLQISWVIPPEMKIDKEWSVCSGDNSKEIDIQNNRIKREKEVFYNTSLEIPPNPKEPWDREMDYDDSLTPEIPTDQLPDDDDNMVAKPAEMAPDYTSNYAAGSSSVAENNRNALGPDLELLAVLLENPQVVFALTAGQGGSLTNEQMVRLLDAMKENAARGGSVSSLVNGLVNKKAEEKVEVSLPSPTPSSDPVTSGWRTESAKNQFSRRSVTVNGDAYAIPGVCFQEASLPTSAPQLTQHAIDPVAHQRFPDSVSGSRNIPSNLTQKPITLDALRHRFPDMVPDQRNIPAAVHGLQSQGPSNAYFLPELGGSQIQSQPHVVSEPWRSPAQSWTGQENLGTSPYSHVDHSSTYNAYGTGEFVHPGPSHADPSWARNRGYPAEPGFESWSPDNSPVRSHDYVDAWDYADPHGRSYNYRPEMPRMQHDHSRYRNRGGRNDGSWWRDRRR